ncbi:MAG: hypothetical protein LBL90_04660 [Prevotellaceae bacterium]|jgi:hypothetical protein|nr:hypothetical protein [Prevotellaceae bacterium]
MKLFVNEKEIILFEGATVTDALRMYNATALDDVKAGKAEVLDAYGNIVALDGALYEGNRLFFRKQKTN